AAHAVAVNAGRTLLAWTELGYNGSEFPGLLPVRLLGRVVAADGKLSAPVTIASISGSESAIGIGGAVATSAGFAVLYGSGYSWKIASLDASGQVIGVRPFDLPAGTDPA